MLVEKFKDKVLYFILFFIVLFCNVAFLVIPAFNIPFYEDSSFFIWLICMRLDTIILIMFFYVNTHLPKSFKYCMLACSMVVLMSAVNIVPFSDGSAPFYYYVVAFTFGFTLHVIGSILIEKFQNRAFVNHSNIIIQKIQKDAYEQMIQAILEASRKGEIPPEIAISLAKDIKQELEESKIF